MPSASWTIVDVQSTTRRSPFGSDVLVLDDARWVAGVHPREVLAGARDVFLGDEERPERTSDPGVLRDAGCVLQRPVHAEQGALVVHEGEEARRRADDGPAEVALALENPLLLPSLREVADDEDELVGPAGDDPALVVALLAAEAHRVLELLHLLLGDGAPAGGENRLGHVRRQTLVHAPPDHLLGWRHEILLAVDLEPAVDPVRADPEDGVGDGGDQRARRRVVRMRLVEPLVGRRRRHPSLVAGERTTGGPEAVARRLRRKVVRRLLPSRG